MHVASAPQQPQGCCLFVCRLACTAIDCRQAKELLTAARGAGVNFYDNAEVYAKGEAETIMGQAFKVWQTGVGG